MKYYAIVVNKYDKNDCFHYISSDYPSKKDFLVDLRCNGYRVRHNRVYTEAEYDALGLLDKRATKRYRIYFQDNDWQISPEMVDVCCSEEEVVRHAKSFEDAGYVCVHYRELKKWEI